MIRSITIVKSNGVVKIAQYCLGDGEPINQGYEVLKFLRTRNLKKFKIKVDALSTTEEGDNSVCSQILYDVYDGKVLQVKLDTEFLKERIFCDWGYVVDLTVGTFHILNGADKIYRLDALPTLEEFSNEWFSF